MIETFDLNNSEQYTLSIRLSTDGFSFSIYNPLSGNDFYYRVYPVNSQRSMAANVKSFLAATEELRHNYKQTNILIHSSRFTPVPLELFEDEDMEKLFYQNLPHQQNEVILCNVLGKTNAVILFSLDKLTHLLLSEQFPTARFFSAVSPQIENLSYKSNQGNNFKLYANIHERSIDAFAFDKGKLLLVNSYQISGSNDVNYYLLNLWQQLKFDQERDELCLIGQADYMKEVTESLQKYIRHVYSINPHAEFNQSASSPIETIPFDIQSLISCE